MIAYWCPAGCGKTVENLRMSKDARWVCSECKKEFTRAELYTINGRVGTISEEMYALGITEVQR